MLVKKVRYVQNERPCGTYIRSCLSVPSIAGSSGDVTMDEWNDNDNDVTSSMYVITSYYFFEVTARARSMISLVFGRRTAALGALSLQ